MFKTVKTIHIGAYALKLKKAPGKGVYARPMYHGSYVAPWLYVPRGTMRAAEQHPWTYWEAANSQD